MGRKKKVKGASGPILDSEPLPVSPDVGMGQPRAGSYHAWSGKGMATPGDSMQCGPSPLDDAALEAEFLEMLAGIHNNATKKTLQQDDLQDSGIFDIFAEDGAESGPAHFPANAAVFDMTDEGGKKMQDDVTTPGQHGDVHQRAPWADVALDDSDFSFHDVGTGQDEQSGVPFANVEELDGDGHAVYDSQMQVGLTMPSDGFEATVDPGRGRREPVVAAAAAAAAAAESLKGEAAATAAANDPDLPGSPEFLLCAGMQEEFQTHARSILPDVFPVSDDGEAFEEPHDETDLSTAGPQVASYHAWSGNGMATPGILHASPISGTQYGQHENALSTAEPQVAASYHAWSGNGMATPGFLHAFPISGTQYGHLPPEDDPDFFPDGGSIFDTDFCLGSQTLRTQYGPLPQQHSHDSHRLLADFVSQDQDQGTQCGPLPQDFLPDAGGGSKDSNSNLQSQSPRTHCGHLPQQHALADVDSFMLQFWQEHQALVQAFNAKADAHHSSMPTFKDADNSDACMRDLTPPEFSTRLASGTQCGPLPQQHNPCGSDRSHVQLGPSYLQVAKDLNLTTPRTQCGPLPRTQTSIPPGKFKGVAGKGKGKGKKHRETEPAMASFATKHRATEPRKGRDKKTAKPLTPGQ